jgi:hypothetical protein
MNGFVDLATSILGQIIEIIFNDLKPPIKSLFTPAWYGGSEMDTMVLTIRSYVVDLQPGLDDDLFPAFMSQLSEKTVVIYLSSVNNKNAKFRIQDSAEQIRNDVGVGYGFLVDYLDRGAVKAVWSVLEHFLALICSSRDALPEAYDAFRQEYWDLPTNWVETVLKCREDKSRDMVDMVKSRARYTARGGEPTIMSRYVTVFTGDSREIDADIHIG